jgi:long-chain fatty acid transport protein
MLTRLPRVARLAVPAAILLAGAPDFAGAAGFSIFEQGARAMGFAGAFTPLANDPSAIFYNVGGIGLLKGKRLYIGGTLVSPSVSFTGDNPFPGAGITESTASTLIPIPALYYTQQFSETVVFGIGVFSPFGLRTEWANPQTYSGRFISQRADLKAIDINPAVAFKLADRLSLGVGFDVRFSKLELNRNVPLVNPFTQQVTDIASADIQSEWNTGFGFNLGLLAKPSDNWSIGLTYRSKMSIDYNGTAIFNQIPTGNNQLDGIVSAILPNGSTPVTSGIDFPALATGGLAYTTDNWTFSAEADWYQWSNFSQLSINFATRPDLNQTIVVNYSNSWQFRFGAERRLTRAWAVRAGYFYDQTPAPPASVSPILPDASRNGFAAGGSWSNGTVRVDFGSWYLNGNNRSTEGVNRDNYNGTYKPSAFTLGASFGYSF